MNDTRVQKYYSTEGIEWRFNPPRAPHLGGLWEAAVKSMKHHLMRVTKDQALNFEKYTTLLHRNETILNSRPLCIKKGDPDPVVLISDHFLIGQPITSLPEPESSHMTLFRRYELINRQVQSFWHLWSKDYCRT